MLCYDIFTKLKKYINIVCISKILCSYSNLITSFEISLDDYITISKTNKVWFAQKLHFLNNELNDLLKFKLEITTLFFFDEMYVMYVLINILQNISATKMWIDYKYLFFALCGTNLKMIKIVDKLLKPDDISIICKQKLAIEHNRIDIIDFLIKKHGFDILLNNTITNNNFCYDYLFKYACENKKIDIVKYFCKKTKFPTKMDIFTIQTICVDVKIAKYVYKKKCFNKNDCNIQMLLQQICSTGNLKMFKFIHKNFKFTKNEINFNNNILLRCTCNFDNYKLMKYLHKHFNFTKQDFQIENNEILRKCCSSVYGKNRTKFLLYLNKKVGLDYLDALTNNNEALYHICVNKNLSLLKCLCETFGMTKQNFICDNNRILNICVNSTNCDMLKYIQTKYNFF